MAIIAVMVAIAIPTFGTQLEKSRESTDVANIRAAYASVAADALTEPDEDHTATVTIVQTIAGWDIGGDKTIARLKLSDISTTLKKDDTVEIKYDHTTNKITINNVEVPALSGGSSGSSGDTTPTVHEITAVTPKSGYDATIDLKAGASLSGLVTKITYKETEGAAETKEATSGFKYAYADSATATSVTEITGSVVPADLGNKYLFVKYGSAVKVVDDTNTINGITSIAVNTPAAVTTSTDATEAASAVAADTLAFTATYTSGTGAIALPSTVEYKYVGASVSDPTAGDYNNLKDTGNYETGDKIYAIFTLYGKEFTVLVATVS